MSDYKDYEIKVTYTGYVNVSAINEAEAFEIARKVMVDDTNYQIAKDSKYLVENVGE